MYIYGSTSSRLVLSVNDNVLNLSVFSLHLSMCLRYRT